MGLQHIILENLADLRRAPIGEAEYARGGRHIHGVHIGDFKPALFNQCRNIAVDIAPAGNAAPNAIEPVLPFLHRGIGRAAMFGKQQSAARLQHPPHTFHCGQRSGDGAERIGQKNSINAVVFKRNFLTGQVDKFNRKSSLSSQRRVGSLLEEVYKFYKNNI